MKFVIEGEPLSKQRHRHYYRQGKSFSYDPQQKEKEYVKHILVKQLRDALNSNDQEIRKEASNLTSNCAYRVYLHFYMPIRESQSNSKRMAKLWNRENHTSKPDLDNLEKFYLDCGNGILFPDDRFINAVGKRKTYSDNPRTEIDVYPEENMPIDPKIIALTETFTPDELLQLEDMAKMLFMPFKNDQKEMNQEEINQYLKDYACNLREILNTFGPQFAKFSKLLKKKDNP